MVKEVLSEPLHSPGNCLPAREPSRLPSRLEQVREKGGAGCRSLWRTCHLGAVLRVARPFTVRRR